MNGTGSPQLVYDGECGFCRYCVGYARAKTGAQVVYLPFQDLPPGFGELDTEVYRHAIQLFVAGQHRASAAEAAFIVLGYGGSPGWQLLYRRLPGFAALSEWIYTFTANHRPLFLTICRLLFGTRLLPLRYARLTGLFNRLLALIFFTAFASFAVQAMGLIGSDGILPVAEYLEAARDRYGVAAVRLVPTLLWVDASDACILGVCFAGMLTSLLMWSRKLPRLAALLATALYLSLVQAGQIFMLFQWDMLLLECGFLALVTAQWPRLGIWLYRWLLFRFMLLSGAVKLISGDPNWRELTALQYHFETQPLPSALAWYAHQLNHGLLRTLTAGVFAIELVLPFFMLGPRRLRAVAAAGTVLLQLAICLTGSYNFFNLLTMALCLLLLDDAMLPRAWPTAAAAAGAPARGSGRVSRAAGTAVLALVLVVSGSSLWQTFSSGRLPPLLRPLLATLEPFHLVNRYGVFAVMTTERREVVIEGSTDGEHWVDYPFRFKPDRPDRAPRWASPHQPRLDWQLWFAALDSYYNQSWMEPLLLGLLTGSEPVADLFADNPFPDAPPPYVRAVVYRYHFAGPEARARSGQWWEREYLGPYSPVLHIRKPIP